MSESVTIELRLPDTRLYPNRHRGHWAKRKDTISAYRTEGYVAAHQAQRGSSWKWEKARIDMMFYFPDRRNRDALNAAAAMKSAIDGVVDAGLIVDDKWANLKPGSIDAEFGSDRDCVLLCFTKLD